MNPHDQNPSFRASGLHPPGSDADLAAQAIALLQEVGPGGLAEHDFNKWHPRVRELLDAWNDRGPVLTIVTVSEIELDSEDAPRPEDIVEEIAILLKDAGFRHVESRVLTSYSDSYPSATPVGEGEE